MKSSLRSQLRTTQKIKFLYFAGAMAAGIAIVEAAGGSVSADFSTGNLVATNGRIDFVKFLSNPVAC